MDCSSRYFSMPVVAILLLASIGCGRKEARQQLGLRVIGLSNIEHVDSKLRRQFLEDNKGKWVVGAESWEDLLAFDSLGTLADLMPEIEENDVIVNWGYQVRSHDEYRANASSKAVLHMEFILAYPRSALSDGGLVLLAYGDAQQMSAEELNEKLIEQGHSSLPPAE